MSTLTPPENFFEVIGEHEQDLVLHFGKLSNAAKIKILNELAKGEISLTNSELKEIKFPINLKESDYVFFIAPLLLSMFTDHSISATDDETMQTILHVVKSIPDYIMPIETKYAVVNQLFTLENALDPDDFNLRFDTNLPALRLPAQTKVPKVDIKTSFKNYSTAVKNCSSESDIIILTTELLTNLINTLTDASLKKQLQVKINQIHLRYFNLEYEECVPLFADIVNALEKFDPKAYAGTKLIISQSMSSSSDTSADRVREKNYTRRFYETALSQYLVGSVLDTSSLNSLSKISRYFGKPGVNAENIDQIINEICHITLPNVEEHNALFDHYEQLQAASGKYDKRERAFRSGFKPRSQEVSDGAGETTYSSNPGVMRANQPNLRYFLSKHGYAARNRKPDIYQAGSSVDQRTLRATYVTSISGHAYFVVALLDKYMKANSKDPDLNKDVNVFIQAFLGEYIKSGFHGLHEILDVLNEPAVKAVFATHNVKLNLAPKAEVLQAAMQATIPYARVLMMHENMQKELLSKPIKLKPNKRGT